jgi:uncharacterized repeat protein (TIGR03803 family)
MRGRELVFTVAAATLGLGIKATAPGASPDARTIQDDSDGMTSGALYGTTVAGGAHGCGVVYKVDAIGITVLYSFTCGADGGNPYSGVIHDSAGNLYGTTANYGAAGVGVVYKLDPTGKETVLHTFTGNPDGAHPSAGVVFDPAGNLYGTTNAGGAHGVGVTFKLDPDGQYIANSFTGMDGAYPGATPNGLVRGRDGSLYGTTKSGGAFGFGVVYKLDATGSETVLYSFNFPDGRLPFAGVTLDSSGNLYGTTFNGGTFNCGTVYKVDPTGKETVLFSFGCDAGGNPTAGVVLDPAGNLYGTTPIGGGHSAGVVYMVDPTGNYTVLHSFTGGADGWNPTAGVVLDSAGNLCGTTFQGGIGGHFGPGIVYKLGPAKKKLTVVYSFTGAADGANPYAGVIVRRQ